jgi:hypothetical protein
MGASVFARNAATMLAVIAAIVLLLRPVTPRAGAPGSYVVKKGLDQPLGALARWRAKG